MGTESVCNILKYHRKLKTTLTRRLKIREKIKNNKKLFKENGRLLWPIFRFPVLFLLFVVERKEKWREEK